MCGPAREVFLVVKPQNGRGGGGREMRNKDKQTDRQTEAVKNRQNHKKRQKDT